MDVVILDPLPLFSQGVLAALGRGRALTSAEELASWPTHPQATILLLTLHNDDSWHLLRRAATRTGMCVVAVLPDSSVTSAAAALKAGAVHVLARDADPPALRRVIAEATDGSILLPLAVLRAAMVSTHLAGSVAAPSDEELRWLRSLASGVAVSTLADSTAYSERAMYRRLSELYARLGTQNRTQALIFARDHGWL